MSRSLCWKYWDHVSNCWHTVPWHYVEQLQLQGNDFQNEKLAKMNTQFEKSIKRSRWHPGTAPSKLKEQLSGICPMRRISKSNCRRLDGKFTSSKAASPGSEEWIRERWRYFPCKQIQMTLPIGNDNDDNVNFWLWENLQTSKEIVC